MRHWIRALLGLLVIGTAISAASPAFADGRRVSGPSVFPQARDPWGSWGGHREVHKELPRHLPPPRHQHGHFDHGHFQRGHSHAPAAVWVPGQWVWNGYYSQWVWAPGHWLR